MRWMRKCDGVNGEKDEERMGKEDGKIEEESNRCLGCESRSGVTASYRQ